jgi:hypothetical protein
MPNTIFTNEEEKVLNRYKFWRDIVNPDKTVKESGIYILVGQSVGSCAVGCGSCSSCSGCS